MTLIRYIWDKMILIICSTIMDCMIGILLLLYGCDISLVCMIWFCRIVLLGAYLGLGYYRLRERKKRCDGTMKALEKSYLISDALPRPENMEEEVYYEMLRAACKGMNDEVTRCRLSRSEYKDYVEEWVHEIKNPVSAVKLLCANHHDEITGEIAAEMESVDYLLEQALYYARSESVEQDFFICRCSLSDAIHDALLQYRTSLLRCGFSIDAADTDAWVYADGKWITFVLGQLISNAVKYRNATDPVLRFASEDTGQSIALMVADNGCGISPVDLPRIFERGFTGSNRKKTNATGMGLYICERLCGKMGLAISAASEKNGGTTITITFPYGPLTVL